MRQLSGLGPTRFLYASRRLSGDSDGHSAFSRTTDNFRSASSPRTRYFTPAVRSDA